MLPRLTRRDFLKISTSMMVSAVAARNVKATSAPSKAFPPAMQLFAIRDLLTKDFAGTLKQVAALGFLEVEAAGFLTLTAAEVKAAMKDAGLRCVSGHYPMQSWQTQLDANLKFASEAGLKYVVSPLPASKIRIAWRACRAKPSKMQCRSKIGDGMRGN